MKSTDKRTKNKTELDEYSDDLLAELGISLDEDEPEGLTPRQERILSGWEDIQQFIQQHGRFPQSGEDRDIFERLYAVRLARLRELPEAHSLLAAHDPEGWLNGAEPMESMAAQQEDILDDDDLLAELGIVLETVEPSAADSIHVLKHVRSGEERQAAEQIAQRHRCQDFNQFKPLFAELQNELKSGKRVSMPFEKNASIQQGDFFIVNGLTAYVAEVGEDFRAPNGERDARLRVIYSNGTESDLLLRSLQRALYADEEGRRISREDALPLFAELDSAQMAEPGKDLAADHQRYPVKSAEASFEPEDLPSGTIYVLRSHSTHPLISAHRQLIHKIGVTGGDVNKRLSQASLDPTYLLAEVEVVATYQLANIQRTKLEKLFHRLFAAVQLDIELQDRFGNPVRPREWFLVPLSVIDEAVRRIEDGSITEMEFDAASAQLVRRV